MPPDSGGILFSRKLPLLLRSRPDQHQAAEPVPTLHILWGYAGARRIEFNGGYLRRCNDLIELRTRHTLSVQPNHRLAAPDPDRVPARRGANVDPGNTAEQVARVSRPHPADVTLQEKPRETPTLLLALVELAQPAIGCRYRHLLELVGYGRQDYVEGPRGGNSRVYVEELNRVTNTTDPKRDNPASDTRQQKFSIGSGNNELP